MAALTDRIDLGFKGNGAPDGKILRGVGSTCPSNDVVRNQMLSENHKRELRNALGVISPHFASRDSMLRVKASMHVILKRRNILKKKR